MPRELTQATENFPIAQKQDMIEYQCKRQKECLDSESKWTNDFIGKEEMTDGK